MRSMVLFTRRDPQTLKPVSHDTRNVLIFMYNKEALSENWGNPLETMLGFKQPCKLLNLETFVSPVFKLSNECILFVFVVTPC